MSTTENITALRNGIKVSVLIITYNHEKFITQAVESALNQKTDFDYEIIISEDFSTDNTRNIVLDLQKQHPEKIKLLLAERNFNSNSFFIRALESCQGQYVALLEGDDYWTSPFKLQKQVDFFDKYPECSICFHDVRNIYEDGSQAPRNSTCLYQKELLDLEDLLENNFCYTCTTMFRRGLFTNFPDWYSKDLIKAGDYPFFVFNAQYGRIGYIHEVMAAYRHHGGGIWSSQSEVQQLINTVETNRFINKYLDFRYREILKSKISHFYYKIAMKKQAEGNLSEAAHYIKMSLLECPFNQRISFKVLFKNLLKIYYLMFFK